MPNRARDATWRLARIALAHDLGKLFESRSVNANAAIADAVGVDRKKVKKKRFFYRLSRGYAAGISGTKLKWRDVVVLLQADEGIRPAMEMWNATLWPFLRGELTPNIGIPELLDHHLARVKFTRVATEEGLRSHLRARRGNARLEPDHYWFLVALARAKDIRNFIQSPVAVADKLTITGLLYIKAYLEGDLHRAEELAQAIDKFLDSTVFKDALGPASGDVGAEIRIRLFNGQLLFSYGQRSTEIVRPGLACDILVPAEDADGFLDVVVGRFANTKVSVEYGTKQTG